MSNENEDQQAALSDLDTFVQGPTDQAPEQVVEDAPLTDSAPVEEVENDSTEKPVEDGFQKRINKVTADKYSAIRERDELKKRLAEFEAKPAPDLVAPTLEQHDFDKL